MLLEAKVVHIPAQPEIDADMSEFGCLSTKTAAAYGEAAVDAGAPDPGDDAHTWIVDALANIFHYAKLEGLDPNVVVESAMRHFEAESESA
jgi:hypothetical protein